MAVIIILLVCESYDDTNDDGRNYNHDYRWVQNIYMYYFKLKSVIQDDKAARMINP